MKRRPIRSSRFKISRCSGGGREARHCPDRRHQTSNGQNQHKYHCTLLLTTSTWLEPVKYANDHRWRLMIQGGKSLIPQYQNSVEVAESSTKEKNKPRSSIEILHCWHLTQSTSTDAFDVLFKPLAIHSGLSLDVDATSTSLNDVLPQHRQNFAVLPSRRNRSVCRLESAHRLGPFTASGGSFAPLVCLLLVHGFALGSGCGGLGTATFGCLARGL